MVGDVHGMRATLEALLAELGYREAGAGWSHPAGRRLVFVGDLIDAGPDPLGCLELVADLVEAGVALAVLGNHEVNAGHHLLGLTPPAKREDRARQMATTLAQLEARPERRSRALDFLQATPTRLELDEGRLRVIHACWDAALLPQLPERFSDLSTWQAALRGGPAYEALEVCLKGPERELGGQGRPDRYGVLRTTERLRWWEHHDASAPLTVFGHYWFSLEREGPPALLGPGRNAACVDYSVARGGRLVALRYPERSFASVACRDLGSR